MKRNLIIRLLSASTLLLCVFAAMQLWGQDDQAPPPEHRGHRHMMSPEKRADHLTKALTLTHDQKSKALSIYQDEQKQMVALRSDSSMSRDDRWAKMKQIHENTVSQIKGILNPDQAKQFDDMQQRMQEGREHHSRDNPPAAAPQQ
jgi:periplasmic protein CpxP/Spy